ncbi:sensor histidine kinase [Cohnella thailandensis]|uniref:Histidine kinase n=1 Tax=Cohnella thailandensis TaxID=557557 RepID=A0A841STF9_9BACL|nr:histidine kinase [Cohnella thailandensis]MBB6632917.1 histidine kinase [Cohnella thailandensis]MBP1975390.1 two-component system sensor histidine kinase YesM [Cohnella thailandensis]
MKLTIFTKIVLVICLLLVSTLLLYSLTNRSSVRLIKQEIQRVKLNELTFLAGDIDNNLSKISSFSDFLVLDKDVRLLATPSFLEGDFELNKLKLRVSDKLNLLHALNNWNAEFTVIYADDGAAFSSPSSASKLSDLDLEAHFRPFWQYEANGDGVSMTYYLAHPYTFRFDPEEVSYVVKARIDIKNVLDYLDRAKGTNENGPFLFSSAGDVLASDTAKLPFLRELPPRLEVGDQGSGNRLIKLDGEQYLVNFSALGNFKDWYVADYTPIDEVLNPIYANQRLYYFSSVFLLLFSILLALLLYRDVQIPIRKLIWGVKKITSGHYTITLRQESNDEFAYLFDRFNEMSREIKELIEKVYMEQIRSKEAKLRQLHSQIQPHFLYNSLAFIKSMAELDEKQAVIDMSMSLSRYFRQSIKFENTFTTLREELELVRLYLTIQSLQMDRFVFSVDVEERLLDLQVPRLLLQPLAENAILHGIEPLRKVGDIRISGHVDGDYCEVSVSDNGSGIEPGRLAPLRNAIYYGADENTAWALHNVYERLNALLGPDAEMELGNGELGGLKVTLRWNIAAEREGTGA